MRHLHRTTAVITGAANGIGRATADALADRGASLALIDIDDAGLHNLQRTLGASFPDIAISTHRCDVSDRRAMADTAGAILDEHGAVDIVINNAGINVTAPFEDHDHDAFERVMDVNFWGVVHGCQLFLPHLKDRPWGHLVNISSAFGIVGVASQSAYSASKFAVRGFSESLHEELANTSVDVSVVHPGCIATSIIDAAHIADDHSRDAIATFFRDHGHPPEAVARRIVDAIARRTHRVVVTPEARLLDWLRRLAPTLGNRLANRLMQRFTDVDLFDD